MLKNKTYFLNFVLVYGKFIMDILWEGLIPGLDCGYRIMDVWMFLIKDLKLYHPRGGA